MNKLYIIVLKVLRKFWLSISSNDDIHVYPTEVSHNAQETSDKIFDLLVSDKPCMIARYGSTELACISNYLSIINSSHSVVKYIKGCQSDWWWNKNIMNQMQQWSGFFPVTEEKLTCFCELMIEDTKQLDVLGSWLKQEKCLGECLSTVYQTHLLYLEPFWCEQPWTKALEGKKVVVVHPFAELIERQYKENRLNLFDNPDVLPEFQIKTVKAVQSLGGNDNGFTDWFEALQWMENEIDKIDYDICLIGCGAYGFPLSAHCKRMGKKAIHMGGALQLLFGIKGKRWEADNYADIWNMPHNAYMNLLNNPYWIRPGQIGKPMNANKVEGACYW